MEIELLYSPGCANTEIARNNLQKAIELSGITTHWREVNLDSGTTPVKYRQYGSPTILIAGKDIAVESGDPQGGT